MSPFLQSCHFFSRYGVTLTVLFILTGLGAEILRLNAINLFQLSETWQISMITLFCVALMEPIATATSIYFIQSRNSGEELSVYDCVMKAWHPYTHLVMCYFMVTSLIMLGFGLYVLPGFYLFYKLLFAEYHVVLNDKPPMESIAASFVQTQGQIQLILPSFMVLIAILLGGGWFINSFVSSDDGSMRLIGAVLQAPLMSFGIVLGFRLFSLCPQPKLKSGV